MLKRFQSARVLLGAIVLLSACGGGDDPVAPEPQRTLAPLEAAQSQQAVVATPVAAAPAVVVKTEAGAPVAGVKVKFTVQKGGGSLARDTATTGTDGIARAGAWTLGTTTGVNTVHASAEGFTTVVITAFGTAGGVAQLVPVAGNGLTAVVGSATPAAPSVKATDAHGNVVRGAVVTFSATQGTIAASVDTTDAAGVATAGAWTLGYSSGSQSLQAASGTATATLTATATTASGCNATPYAIGAQVTGTWEDADCASGGIPYDRYTLTATQQADFRLTVNGAAGRQVRVRRGSATGPYIALMPVDAVVPASTNPVSLKYVLAPDTYVIEVAAPSAGDRSSYTLATALESGVSCGTVTWYTPDVTVSGTLAQGDCTFEGAYEDWMLGILPLGMRIRTTLTSAGMRPVIAIKDDRAITAPVMAREYNATAGTTVRANWTTTYAGSHEVIVTTFDMTDAGGTYSLRIDGIDAANSCVANPFTIGNVTQAGWDASDCVNGSRPYDRYVPGTGAPRAFRATLNGPADKSVAVLVDGVEIADKRDAGTTAALPTHWFLKPGAVELRVATPSAGTTYTLGTIADGNITACRQVFAQQGATIPAQRLETTDCTFNGAYEDRILLRLTAGTTFTSSMTAGFANVLVLRDLTVSPATIVASHVRSTPGTASISYTVPTTGIYELIATSYNPGVTGDYTITIP